MILPLDDIESITGKGISGNFGGTRYYAGVLYPLNGFLLNPMIAGAAMALSSISAVTNSLRLKYSV